ncbi:MAG: hypothetical protein Q9226_001480 [Calogaya cf. arnoldii]
MNTLNKVKNAMFPRRAYSEDGLAQWPSRTSFLLASIATSVYRWVDVVSQVGWPAFGIYNFGDLGGIIFGCAVAHSVSPETGAGVGFGLYIVCSFVALFIDRTPDSLAPRFFGKNAFANRFWWLAFYQGNQLRRDLNVTVAIGKAWSIPLAWGVCLRYVAAPVLGIIFSFSYPSFTPDRSDSLEVWRFFVSQCVIFVAIAGFLLPRFLSILVPKERRGEGERTYAPQVILGSDDLRVSQGVENGDQDSSGLDSGSDKAYDEKINKIDKMEK